MITRFQVRAGLLVHFLVGVMLASRVYVNEVWLFWFMMVVLVVVFLKKEIILWGFLVMAGLFGMVWLNLDRTDDEVDFYESRKIGISGVIKEVIEKPRVTDLYVLVRGKELVVGGEVEDRQVLVSDFSLFEWEVGQRVLISGVFRNIFDEFEQSYAQYLALRGVLGVVKDAEIEVLEETEFSLERIFFLWKRRILLILRKLFPEPEAGFLAGLLLGDRSGLTTELKDKFQKTGLTHILAVSGYNVSLVLLFFSWFLRSFSRRFRLGLSIFGVILFVLLIGFDVPAVRAGIMGILGLLAINSGRKQNVLWLILLAASLMVFWRPRSLMFDIGFQLSFAATFGLVVFSGFFFRLISRLKIGHFLAEICAATLAANFMTIPIIWWHFREIYLISFLANLLVVPFVSLATILGVISLFFAFLLADLAKFLIWPEFVLLRFILWLVEILA